MNSREVEITNIGVVTHDYTDQGPKVFVQLDWDPEETFEALVLEDPKYNLMRVARKNNQGKISLTDLTVQYPWVRYLLDKLFLNDN